MSIITIKQCKVDNEPFDLRVTPEIKPIQSTCHGHWTLLFISCRMKIRRT